MTKEIRRCQIEPPRGVFWELNLGSLPEEQLLPNLLHTHIPTPFSVRSPGCPRTGSVDQAYLRPLPRLRAASTQSHLSNTLSPCFQCVWSDRSLIVLVTLY